MAEECRAGSLASSRRQAAAALGSVLVSAHSRGGLVQVCVGAIVGLLYFLNSSTKAIFSFTSVSRPPSISLAFSVQKYLKIYNSLESPHQEFEGVPQERGSWRVCRVWVLLPETIAPSCEVRLAFTIFHRAVID